MFGSPLKRSQLAVQANPDYQNTSCWWRMHPRGSKTAQFQRPFDAKIGTKTGGVAPEEPTPPANILKTNDAGIRRGRISHHCWLLKNKEVNRFPLPHDPPDPLENGSKDTYSA